MFSACSVRGAERTPGRFTWKDPETRLPGETRGIRGPAAAAGGAGGRSALSISNVPPCPVPVGSSEKLVSETPDVAETRIDAILTLQG
ncbi:rCG49556 [Rattus norvegicus]|uniref:RCG49556 n=1 Tax=Rattus norvegicus TaxID=10116 RepID=A6J2N5_RAT|nr:rCG49556 [Rattus norvegicus]